MNKGLVELGLRVALLQEAKRNSDRANEALRVAEETVDQARTRANEAYKSFYQQKEALEKEALAVGL